jgi:NAD(P)-dependent dehydrogenase (short-subunit alcohol dehydrogenase family)
VDARRILISGGTSGIGYACAEHLASQGARVWVLGSNEESADAARHALPLAGAGACDVSDERAVDDAVRAAVACLGGLDGVFVNAGVDGQAKPAAEVTAAHFHHVLNVNVIGAFLVARAALRDLARPGAIVFNASSNALRPEAHFVDYNASKAAVVAIAKTLALEVSAEGVSVTAICPGYLPTRMTTTYLDDPEARRKILGRIPAGRIGALAEVAALVDFLLGPGCPFLTGGVIAMDGGSSI